MPTPSPRMTGAVTRRDGVAGAEVDDPAGAGVVQPLDLGDPVDRADEDRLGHLVSHLGVDADLRAPSGRPASTPSARRGVWKPTSTWTPCEDRAEDRAAAQLVLALRFFLLGDLAAVQLEAGQLLGRAGDDDRAPAVADRQHGRQHRADVRGELLEQFGDALGVDVGDRHHRRLVAAADHAAAARDQRARGTDQLQHARAARRPWCPWPAATRTPRCPGSARPSPPAACRRGRGPGA